MGIFKGLVAPRRSTFKVLKSVDDQGNKTFDHLDNVVELVKADSGLPGKEAHKMLEYFVNSERGGDLLLNNYSFYITVDKLSSSLTVPVKNKFGKEVYVPNQVLTLQHLRDAVESVGKHLLIECVQARFTRYPKPKLCIHDSRKTLATPDGEPKRSVRPFSEFKDFR